MDQGMMHPLEGPIKKDVPIGIAPHKFHMWKGLCDADPQHRNVREWKDLHAGCRDGRVISAIAHQQQDGSTRRHPTTENTAPGGHLPRVLLTCTRAEQEGLQNEVREYF